MNKTSHSVAISKTISQFHSRLGYEDEKNQEVFIVLGFSLVSPQEVVSEIDLKSTLPQMPLPEIEPLDKQSTTAVVIDDYHTYIGEIIGGDNGEE